MSDQTNLVAEISPFDAPDEQTIYELYTDTAYPDEYVVLMGGEIVPLSALRGKHNVCIRKAD